MSASTYYQLLGVSPAADSTEIEAAFRRLATQLHPDVNPAPDATRRMQALNDAYRVLRDGARRRLYDTALGLSRRPPAPGGRESGDLLRRFDDLEVSWSATLADWARDWALGLDEAFGGRRAGLAAAGLAAERCRDQLDACKQDLDRLAPGPDERRLVALARVMLDCQITLARQAASFCAGPSEELLEPIAALGTRLSGLARTIAAERLRLSERRPSTCRG